MTTTIHSVATRTYLGMLKGLSAVLKKAEANAAERKIDPSVFLNARLAPDMFPLTRQVQIATDHVKGSLHRVAGTQPPKWDDTETSFPELLARIDRAVDVVNSFTPESLNGREGESVTMRIGTGEMTFAVPDYLFGFAFGNFYFHVTTAYNILRQHGVPLGKGDYFGR